MISLKLEMGFIVGLGKRGVAWTVRMKIVKCSSPVKQERTQSRTPPAERRSHVIFTFQLAARAFDEDGVKDARWIDFTYIDGKASTSRELAFSHRFFP
jgi:hypothetical protein